MIEKIEIIQENYGKILEIAKNSNSNHDLCKKLGWNNSKKNNDLRGLLIFNNFDFSIFPNVPHNKSIFDNKEKLEEVVKNSFSYKEVIEKFVDYLSAGHYISLKKYIKKYNISIEHFTPYSLHIGNQKKTSEEIFIKNSLAHPSTIRNRILKENIIPYKCKCGNEGCWQGQKMALQLDHINGNRTDNRLENLEFLCPNCHAITPTYGSKNKKSNKRSKEIKTLDKQARVKKYKKNISIETLEENKEEILNNIGQYKTLLEIIKEYGLDDKDSNYQGLKNLLEKNKTPEVEKFLSMLGKKVVYPPLKKLRQEVEEKGYEAVGRDLGCSGNAVKKYLNKHTLKVVKYPEMEKLKELIKTSSYTKIAKSLGCSETALRKHLAKNDPEYFAKQPKIIVYPELDELMNSIKEKGFVQVGKELGCSDNAIRSYLIKNGIDVKSIKKGNKIVVPMRS